MATDTRGQVENGSYLFGHPGIEQELGGPILRVTHESPQQTRPAYPDSMQRQTEAYASYFNVERGIAGLKAHLGL